MKKTTISITYDEDKLNAIKVFLAQKNLDLDTELTDALDALFKKHVPSSVRDFLELKDCVAPLSPAKKPTGAGKEQANG